MDQILGKTIMLGRLLVIDSDVTSRFTMKARLGAANHQVQTAHDVAEATRSAKGAGAVLLRNTDPAGLVRDIAVLKRRLGVPVIVICDAVQRQAAFRAGAEHVLDNDCHDSVLRARLRSWMAHPVEVDSGFAETAAEFDPPDQIALVTNDAALSSDWRHAVEAATGHRLQIMAPSSALTGLPPKLATMLVDGGGGGSTALQHLADLRALLTAERRGTALAFIQRCPMADEEARALDIGAAEVLPAILSLAPNQAELSARLGLLLRNGLEGERRYSDARLARRLASVDPLTGLANRRRISMEIATAAKKRKGFGILMVDIDRFKSINDNHGHAAGDSVLKEVAATLMAAVCDQGMVARYGGEEFVVLLPGVDETVAISLAERIRQKVSILEAQTIGLSGPIRLRVSVSVGVATCGERTDWVEQPADNVLRQADAALLAAKGAGRNLVMLARETFAA
ncbi:MAG: diguanylate cyclase [Paracoccus sp. (in: a-proteobacteria)]